MFSRRDSNLLTADAALKILFLCCWRKKLKFACKMADVLKLRIRERRRMELSAVLKYLRNTKRDDPSAETGYILPIPNETVIKKHG